MYVRAPNLLPPPHPPINPSHTSDIYDTLLLLLLLLAALETFSLFLVGVPEHEDDRVAPQEELGDVALLVLLSSLFGGWIRGRRMSVGFSWVRVGRWMGVWVLPTDRLIVSTTPNTRRPMYTYNDTHTRDHPTNARTPRTGLAFLPLPDLGTSVHISFTFSSSLVCFGLLVRAVIMRLNFYLQAHHTTTTGARGRPDPNIQPTRPHVHISINTHMHTHVQVAVAVERLDAPEQLVVVPDVHQHLFVFD